MTGNTVILNVLSVWDGHYPFLRVHEQPFGISVLWFILILGGAYAAAVLMKKLREK